MGHQCYLPLQTIVVAFFLVCGLLLQPAAAQESIDAREGFNTGMHVGIALAMCFGVLTVFIVGVNCLHFAYLRKRRA